MHPVDSHLLAYVGGVLSPEALESVGRVRRLLCALGLHQWVYLGQIRVLPTRPDDAWGCLYCEIVTRFPPLWPWQKRQSRVQARLKQWCAVR